MRAKAIEDAANEFLDKTMELNDLPGLAMGLSRGEEVWTGARGVRDRNSGDPLEAGDVFHCASISKLLTSSAVLLLQEAGELKLDDLLKEHLPELKFNDERAEGIRLEHLLSHTSGLGDEPDYHWEWAETKPDALEEYIHSHEVLGAPFLWAPGEGEFRYSNTGYEILGYLVERKTGMPYEDFVRKYLMEPAGMKNSTMKTFERIGVAEGSPCGLITEKIRRRNENTGSTSGRERAPVTGGSYCPMALPYDREEDRSITPIKYYPYNRRHAPSSTLTSTLEDLLRWGRVHLDGFAEAEGCRKNGGSRRTILSPDTYRQIFKGDILVPNNGERMGLGWFKRQQLGYQLYGHEGGDVGFRASLWICPQLDMVMAVLSNISGAPTKKICKKFFAQK